MSVSKSIAVSLLMAWAILFAYLTFSGDVYWLAALAAVWLVYNFVGWLVPDWRLTILGRRGQTVGLGFSIAAGLVTTLALSGGMGLIQTIGMLVLNTLLFYIPFLTIGLLKIQPGRPHMFDIILSAYVFAMAYWWPFDFALSAQNEMRLGGFVALATAVTVFLGTRLWNRSRWELTIRKQHRGKTATIAGLVVGAVLVDGLHRLGTDGPAWLDIVYRGAVLAPLNVLLIFGVVQFAVREMLRPRGLPVAEWGAGIVSALLFLGVWYATWQGFALTGVTVALGGAWLAQKTTSVGSVGCVTVLGYVLFSLL